MFINKKLIFVLAILFGSVIACNDDDLDLVNPNGVTIDRYFTNEIELTSGVNSIYAQVQSSSLVAREWFFTHDLRSDEVASGGGQLEAPRAQILTGVQGSGNSLVNSVFSGWYRVIHRANTVLGSAENVEGIDEAVKKRLLGEAYFLRAWAYFELGVFFGGVPIYTEYAESVDAAKAKSSLNEVYAQALSDLNIAEQGLLAVNSDVNLGRATKGAAQMLKARIYAQMGDYANVKTELTKLVNSGTYSLTDRYRDNFEEETEFNSESIFEIVFINEAGSMNWGADGDGVNAGQEVTMRSQEYSAVGWRNIIPSNKVVNEYESKFYGDEKDDPRFSMNFWATGDLFNNGADVMTDELQQGNGSTYHGEAKKLSWKKYSVIYKEGVTAYYSGINQRIMRYADALLLLADAENELGNSDAALKLMNQVRDRADVMMPHYPTARFKCSNKAEIRAAVQHERMVELCGEQVRNQDIVRWRKNGQLASEPLSYFQANRDELLPYPITEITNNPNLSFSDQNPGY